MDLFNVSSRVVNAGLVVLAVMDVVLVGVALRSNHTSVVDTSPVRSTSASSDSTRAPVARPSAKRSVTPSATATVTASPATAVPLQTMLAAIDNQRAWRVKAGSCSTGGAALAITTDGGGTWAEANAPLRRIVRVRADDSQAALVVGADSGCAPELKDTSDGGGTWTTVDIVEGSWFRDPENGSVVGTPGPSTSKPCGGRAVLDLAILAADQARVLCADGLVRSTTDTGSSWTDSGKVTGAVALAVLSTKPGQTFVARLDAPRCAGVQILRVGERVATSCIRTAMPENPGQIALSLVDGGGWLAVGDKTIRSTDDLVTWSVS